MICGQARVQAQGCLISKFTLSATTLHLKEIIFLWQWLQAMLIDPGSRHALFFAWRRVLKSIESSERRLLQQSRQKMIWQKKGGRKEISFIERREPSNKSNMRVRWLGQQDKW